MVSRTRLDLRLITRSLAKTMVAMFFAVGMATQPSAYAQTDCTVSVNGQIIFVGPFGSRFNLRNIPAGPELFREGLRGA